MRLIYARHETDSLVIPQTALNTDTDAQRVALQATNAAIRAIRAIRATENANKTATLWTLRDHMEG